MKKQKNSDTNLGFSLGRNFSSLNVHIFETFERDGKKWKPREPDFEKLVGQWAIIEFHVLSFLQPVLCLFEDDEDKIFMSNGIPLKAMINPMTLEFHESWTLYPDGVWKIHVLESPSTTKARNVINEVEEEKLQKSIESSIATYSHTILKLKKRVRDPKTAELINYLMEKIDGIEETYDESEVLKNNPSYFDKTKNKLKPMATKNIKKTSDVLKRSMEEIHNTTIDEIIENVRERINDEEDNLELAQYHDWIEILNSHRDKIVDEVIRELYFETDIL